eukprot:CAMPEP_0184215070 /NCGR_PEP_ID=MMETSP0976-20121227/14976_1 /TAXON_ID=483370 /ORGANISM="non described non described, Strain CCMP2097" /LENGTH=188 /DNA_ID=CAMNT_0026519835 /DNA_START=11 /DNA_END=578 /DNA_ORIENTATION=+
MAKFAVLALLAVAQGFAPAPPVRFSVAAQSAADCVEDGSCSVDELSNLLKEVKAKAEEIRKLEAKLTALAKDGPTLLEAYFFRTMAKFAVLALLAVAQGFAPAPPVRFSVAAQSAADCVEDGSCSVDELSNLLKEVKAKAEEIRKLEAKLTALNKDDSTKLKGLLKAEECELNSFDGCSAWYYDEEAK